MSRDFSHIKSGTSEMVDVEERRRLQREYKRDVFRIKRILGIGVHDPLPKCPCQSVGKVRSFENKGDYTHSKTSHRCHECGCSRTAGYGTDHYGYGMCSTHEKATIKALGWKKGKIRIEETNMSHKHALINGHPGVYRNVNKFTEMVRVQGDDAEKSLSLQDEISIARGLVQEVISINGGHVMEPVLDNETGNPLHDDDGNPVMKKKEMMEYVGVHGNQRPISDKTRLELMAKLLPVVQKVIESENKIRSESSFSENQFRVWFAQVWTMIQTIAKDIDQPEEERQYKSSDAMLSAIMAGFKSIGEPRTVRTAK